MRDVGRLEGKTAFVTGGASGIGRGIVERFAAEGAQVTVADVDVEVAATVARGLASEGFSVACDVTDEGSVEAAFAASFEHWGGLDVVVANAGAGGFSPIMECELEEWQRIVDLCQTGVFLTIKHAGRALVGTGGGSIICIASLNATQPAAGMAPYCSAKAAVAMLAQVAAMELGEHGVRVNTIAPGLIETRATELFFGVPGVVEEFLDNTTVGRHGLPEDVAAVATFLASDESSFVSAGHYTVDGGARTGRYPNLPRLFAPQVRS